METDGRSMSQQISLPFMALANRVLVGKSDGKNHWGDLGVDGWIILGWISGRWDVCMWTGLGWPRIETGDGRL